MQIAGRGWGQRQTKQDETLIYDVELEFQDNGTPLYRKYLAELTKTRVHTFSKQRPNDIVFNGNIPGTNLFLLFSKRHSTLAVGRRVFLEADGSEAMHS